MTERFPLDNGNLWESDLEKAVYLTPSIDFKKVYCADVKRHGFWTNSEEVEKEMSIFKQLMAAGKTNVESFISFGSKHYDSSIVPAYECYLTACTNEIFKYICNSEISIDDIFEDYRELSKHAQTNTTIRFGLNMINQIITQLVELNDPSEICVAVEGGINQDMLHTFYRIRVAFYRVPMFVGRAIYDPRINTPVMDKTGLYLDVKKNSSLYNRLKESLDGNFNNRTLRLYLSGCDSTQSLRSVTIYQTLTDDYKIRLL